MRVVGGRIGRLIVDARAIINNLAATQSERAGRSRFREDTREKHDGSLLLPALINPRAPPLSLSLSLSLSRSTACCCAYRDVHFGEHRPDSLRKR